MVYWLSSWLVEWIFDVMGKHGRTRRQRLQKKLQRTLPDTEYMDDKMPTLETPPIDSMPKEERVFDVPCAALRRWMVSKVSKHQLKDTLQLVPHRFSNTGRGLKAKKCLKPGSLIVSVPLPLLITPTTVINSDFGQDLKGWNVHFTPHQLLSLFLVVEHNKGHCSDWYPFIGSLPTDYTLPHYFSEEELKLLPPQVAQQAESCRKRAVEAFEQVLSFCETHWQSVRDWLMWEKFRWAWCTVSSRSVFLETDACVRKWVDLEHSQENNTALCPYLDLLNHTSTARVQAGLNPETECYEIVTFDSYRRHDEVFLNYGPHDNVSLFLQYGFTLPDNIQNAVSFSVDDFLELKDMFKINLWDQKMEVLRKNNLCKKLTCTLDGVSWNLQTALTILAMDWNELRTVRQILAGGPPSEALAAKSKQLAQHLIQAALARNQTFLVDKHSSCQTSPYQQLAQSLLMDDINILNAALQDVT